MRKVISGLILIAFSGVVLAGNCPNELKTIDAKLSAVKLAPEQMMKIKDLRNKGAQEHMDGKHGDSMKSLGEAKKMLGI
ncbi:MAG: hypothetical protein EXR40_03665 [Nitrosomonadaceae bacterium]|nr:hypothetical protein [Nitrosomonadaceae bacterium]